MAMLIKFFWYRGPNPHPHFQLPDRRNGSLFEFVHARFCKEEPFGGIIGLLLSQHFAHGLEPFALKSFYNTTPLNRLRVYNVHSHPSFLAPLSVSFFFPSHWEKYMHYSLML